MAISHARRPHSVLELLIAVAATVVDTFGYPDPDPPSRMVLAISGQAEFGAQGDFLLVATVAAQTVPFQKQGSWNGEAHQKWVGSKNELSHAFVMPEFPAAINPGLCCEDLSKDDVLRSVKSAYQ